MQFTWHSIAQSNGLDERTNQTLQNMLAKSVVDQKSHWDEFIDTEVFAYNTSCHESTCYSPFWGYVWTKSCPTNPNQCRLIIQHQYVKATMHQIFTVNFIAISMGIKLLCCQRRGRISWAQWRQTSKLHRYVQLFAYSNEYIPYMIILL